MFGINILAILILTGFVPELKAQSNWEAADKLKEILSENVNDKIKQKLTEILKALDSFDFDTANELLNTI